MTPTNFPPICDGCNAPFSISHALQCKRGGLVIRRHNEVRDEVADLAAAAFAPSQVRHEPRIDIASTSASEPTSTTNPIPIPIPTGDRGDLSIRGLYDRNTDCIIDFSVTDLDSASNRVKTSDAIFKAREEAKKSKYQSRCAAHRRDFSPFIVSTDGLLSPEALNIIQRIARRLSEKWHKPYSSTMGYVRARLSCAIIRATHLCLRGSRISSTSISFQRYQWEPDLNALGSYHLMATTI
jgi:hypothetical protein